MKYPAFFISALVLALCIEARAQAPESNDKAVGNNPCEQYKIGIIPPERDVDFKIRIIVPPKNIDQAMVINPCPAEHQVVVTPRRTDVPPFARPSATPSADPNAFFKAPPFTIRNKFSR